jgi:hypothetical protein
MVPSTRLAEKTALNRILGEVCNLEDDSNIHKACEHESILNMNALIVFTALEVEDIDYMDGTVRTKLNKGHKGIIYALQSMAIYRRSINDAIPEDWSGITREEFNEYRSSLGFLTARAGLPNPNLPAATASSPFVRSRDPVADFMKGVRRGPNLFVPLKQDKQWDSWNLSTILPKLGPKVCQIFLIRISFL